MNDLAILLEPYGRIGSLEQIMPEYLDTPIHESGAHTTWRGAVGMVRTGRIGIQSKNIKAEHDDGFGSILSSIIVSTKSDTTLDFAEFYGVIFFRPLEDIAWGEQISVFKQSPSMFEAIHPTQLVSKMDYVFYSRRTTRSRGRERGKL